MADNFIIPASAGSRPGRYDPGFAPFQTAWLDDSQDQTVTDVVLMCAAQVSGKTTTLLGLLAYHIAADPSGILAAYPTMQGAQAFSREKFAPVVRANPLLRKAIRDHRSRDSGNTILLKSYPGGNIAFVGSQVPEDLRARPRRVVILDEIDGFADDCGGEGDPIQLADARTESFSDAIKYKSSTPTVTGHSKIEDWFKRGDQRRWFVPCHSCGERQVLKWSSVRWEDGREQDATYECQHCKAQWNDTQRKAAVMKGEWRATAEFTGIRSYHLNGLNSPFPAGKGFTSNLHRWVVRYQAVKDKPESLKAWTNTFLAETHEPKLGKSLDPRDLFKQREIFPKDHVPEGVQVITAGVDVQHDRLEVTIAGWGSGEEAFPLEHLVIPGRTQTSTEVWKKLDEVLERKFTRHDGVVLPIARSCVDCGDGALYWIVVRYAQKRFPRVLAVKGSSSPGKPMIGREHKGKFFWVGTDTIKGILYHRLDQIEADMVGRYHFPKGEKDEVVHGFSRSYFEQLVSEKMVIEIKDGKEVMKFKQTPGIRNEALDCCVYAYAALINLNVQWDKVVVNRAKQAAKLVAPEPETAAQEPETTPKIGPKTPRIGGRRPGNGRSFVSNW